MACAGNPNEICGGSNAISVFNNTLYQPPANLANVTGTNYTYQGCYKEITNSRLLASGSYTSSTNMTVENCVAFCAAKGTSGVFAGVEFASQCFCGASLPSTAVKVADSSCNKLCTGNNKEWCGGSSLLNVYGQASTS